MNFTLKNRLRFLPETVIVSIIAVPLILTEKSTHFMYNHTCRMGNGSGSRRRLLNSVQAALKSPFTGRSPPRSHHPELSEGIAAPTTSLSHRFVLCTCCGVLYASGTHLSSPGRKFFWQPPTGHGIMGTLSEERQEWI